MDNIDGKAVLELCRKVIAIEATEVARLEDSLPPNLFPALDILFQCRGLIMVVGIGKSGHVGRKIAATLSSTGSPAFFMHSAEAGHGDSGVMSKRDVVLAISQSGESDEFNLLWPLISQLGIKVVSITGNPKSSLALRSDACILSKVEKEACPLNLAPTSSTTVTLVIGDVLAMCLLKMKGFTPEDFARSHPSGMLGRRLLLRVKDIMVAGDDLPRVEPDTLLSEVIIVMSRKGLGMTTVVDENLKVMGVFTDGDLRRTLQAKLNVHRQIIGECMTTDFCAINPQSPAIEAIQPMEDNKITSLVVMDERRRLLGILTMHNLIHSRLV